MNARTAILDSIQRGTPDADVRPEEGYAAIDRAYTRRGLLSRSACLDLMRERLEDYGAGVTVVAESGIAAAIMQALAARGIKRVVAPNGLPEEWRVNGVQWIFDGGLDVRAVESADGVVTASTCGIAESGTIVLHHTETEGRRMLTLLPDFHLCVLDEADVVETYPEYAARCSVPPRIATFISGPSATADIEMTRIQGVHGPRNLHVILVTHRDTTEISESMR